jgi:putative transposase
VEETSIARAYRVTLDLTPKQEELFNGHAGASRACFNLAHSAKREARKVWRQRVRALADQGMPLPEAMKAVKVKIPGYNLIDKARVRVRGTGRSGKPEAPQWGEARKIFVDGGIEPEITESILKTWAEYAEKRGRYPATQGIAPWMSEYPNALAQQAIKDCDGAWDKYFKRPKIERKKRRPSKVTRPCGGDNCNTGPCSCKLGATHRCSIMCHCRCDCEPAGFPRYKRKDSAKSFYLNNVEARLVDGSNRRLRLGGKIGEVRTLEGVTVRRLRRAITKRGAKIQSVTVSASGGRWYASIVAIEDAPQVAPTKHQKANGAVGVDLGVKNALALSDGTIADRPDNSKIRRSILKAQRVLSRREKGGANWRKALDRLSKLKHLEAEQRKSWTHKQTKLLATGYECIAIEDLSVRGMTASAKGSDEKPGSMVKQKAGLNRRILENSFFEFRRQLEYKAGWYGSRVVVADRWFASSKICSHCLVKKNNLPLSVRVFKCDHCGFVCDRDVNAARNLVRCVKAPVEDGSGGKPSARVSRTRKAGIAPVLKVRCASQEDLSGKSGRSPCGSNATHTPN